MRFALAFTLGFAFAGPATAFAEAVSISALLAAANDHPSVRASQSDMEAASFDKDAAKWRQFPTAKLDATNKFNDPNAVTFTLEQPIWNGGSIAAGIAFAEENVLATSSAVDETLLSLQREIARNGIELNRLNRQLVIARNDVQALELLNETMSLRVKNQISPLAELTTVQARLSQANSQRFQIDGGIKRTQITLYEATGLNVDSIRSVDCSVGDDYSIERLLEEATVASPTIARLAHEASRSRFNVEQANAELLPRVVLGFENTHVSGSSNDNTSTAYIAFRYQLSDGLSSQSRIAAARSKMNSADYAQRKGMSVLQREIHSLVEAYASASNQIKPLEQLVQSNESLMVSYLAQYKVGKKSWLDVMNAQREYTQAQYSLVDAESTRCVSALELGLLTSNTFFVER